MKKLTLSLLFLVMMMGCGAEILVSPLVMGVVYWMEGEAHKYYAHDPDVLYRATKRACMDLQHSIDTDEADGDDYYIVAGGKDRFKIKIRQVEKGIAEVKIRVDFMGDKPYAELIYKKIDNQLSVIEFDEHGRPTKK
jgi:hypothetical protein